MNFVLHFFLIKFIPWSKTIFLIFFIQKPIIIIQYNYRFILKLLILILLKNNLIQYDSIWSVQLIFLDFLTPLLTSIGKPFREKNEKWKGERVVIFWESFLFIKLHNTLITKEDRWQYNKVVCLCLPLYSFLIFTSPPHPQPPNPSYISFPNFFSFPLGVHIGIPTKFGSCTVDPFEMAYPTKFYPYSESERSVTLRGLNYLTFGMNLDIQFCIFLE